MEDNCLKVSRNTFLRIKMAKKNYSKLGREELLKIVDKQDKELATKKYGIVWDAEKEPEKVVQECADNLPILKLVKDKEIKNSEEEDNILIEGDNYHALTVLNYTHKEKIDVIYIDPPYNTGNKKEWKYNDHWIDGEDGYKHSKWLNFMEKRLNLAKKLLKKTGVIFISIDDHEVAQLKLLCDKVFGENNFIGNLIWESKLTGGHDSKHLNSIHEYVLCYAKDSQKENILNKRMSEKVYSNLDSENNLNFKWDSLWTVSHGYTKNCDYPIESLDGTKIFPWMCHKDKEKVKGVARWFWNKENYIENKNKLMIKKDKKGNWKVYKKVYSGTEIPYQTIFDKNIVGGTSHGKETLSQIFGNINVFDNPKPIQLIKEIIKIGENKDSIILDFFAGSGTTAHAVLDLNKDGGKRKFILCTNNEDNNGDKKKICSDICYPRIEKVMNGYKNSKGENVAPLGGNLQYFQTALVKDSKNRDQIKINLTQECTEMLCVKENIFNLKKESKDFKIFQSNKKGKFLCVYYNFFDKSFNEFLKELKATNGKKVVYMFSLENKVDKELFKGIENIKFEAIPQKILEIYKQLIKLNIIK